MASKIVSLLSGGVLDAVPKIIDSVRGKSPEDAVELQKLLSAHQDAVLQVAVEQRKLDLQELQMQVDVNKVDASSQRFFQYGWRPYVGWVCGTGLLYEYLLRPVMTWGTALYGIHYGLDPAMIAVMALPNLDMGTLVTCLGGMLGLGAMRMNERLAGKV